VVASESNGEIRLSKLANLAGRDPYVAYTIAIGSVVLATFVRFGIDPYIVPPAPFATYYPAIILAAFFCGLGPAIATVLLSGLVAWYVFLPPNYSFALDKPQAATLVLFFIIAGTNVAVVGLLNAALVRIATYERFARSAADELAIELRTSN